MSETPHEALPAVAIERLGMTAAQKNVLLRVVLRDLTSIYVAILLVSCALLLHRDDHAAAALLGVQVAYKVTTPFTVGRLRNPVVLGNLAIAALHLVTLATHAAAPS